MLTKRRIERLKAIKPDPPETLQWRCKVRLTGFSDIFLKTTRVWFLIGF